MAKKSFISWIDRLVDWVQTIARGFSRLQWKLTVTYTLVTVGLLTLLLGGILLYSSVVTYQSPQLGVLLTISLANSCSEIVPAFQTDPPDQAILQEWLDRSMRGNNLVISRKKSKDTISFSWAASRSSLIVILDTQGKVIDSNHPEIIHTGDTLSDSIPPFAQTILQRALQGEDNPELLQGKENGPLIAAAAIRQDFRSPIKGAAYVQLEWPSRWEMLLYALMAVFNSAVVLTVSAVVIGTIFSFLIARGLVKRLKSVSETATAWGRGDFSQRNRDRGKDEIGILARDMNKVAAQLENLMHTRQELAALDERNRLARDLHDSVKQQVFATTMNLGAALALWERNPQEALQRVDTAAALSRQSQHELTQLIQTLRPAQFSEQNLVVALREYFSIWQRNTGIAIQLTLPPNLNEIPSDIQEMLYRICQEAFSNIARHSGATSAKLVIEAKLGEVVIRISDDGHGFDPSKPSSGLGLKSMSERVQSLGGKFKITSGPAGTQIIAALPWINEPGILPKKGS